MSINRLQRELEALYRLDPRPEIENFLITTARAKEILNDSTTNDTPKFLGPQVLVREQEGEVQLAVHLGDDIVKMIAEFGPENLDLQSFCSVVEEVSHYTYLVWNAQNNRSVTQLDIEFQGEIDKYMMGTEYFSDEPHLISKLFEAVLFDPDHTGVVQGRYRKANRLGGKFAKWIHRLRTNGTLESKIRGILQEFYRMDPQKRISRFLHQ